MKKLYENIDNIHIRGSVGQLSEVVRAMDISLQNIADNTDQLTAFLIKYSATNKGTQYENTVKASLQLRDMLYQASLELNEMQNQIVIYQNKIYRYEEINESATRPNRYMVTKRPVSVETGAVQFNRSDMIDVVATLRNYSERVYHHLRSINEKKSSIASIWRDSQYDDFSDFVDSVTKCVVEGIRIFEEYVIYLEEKIKELN